MPWQYRVSGPALTMSLHGPFSGTEPEPHVQGITQAPRTAAPTRDRAAPQQLSCGIAGQTPFPSRGVAWEQIPQGTNRD